MKTFKILLTIAMIISFAGIIAGYHQQITIFLMSGICYVAFQPKRQTNDIH